MILYNPRALLKQIAPKKKIQSLVTKTLTLKKAVLSMFNDVEFISKKRVTEVALNTIKQYRCRLTFRSF